MNLLFQDQWNLNHNFFAYQDKLVMFELSVMVLGHNPAEELKYSKHKKSKFNSSTIKAGFYQDGKERCVIECMINIKLEYSVQTWCLSDKIISNST